MRTFLCDSRLRQTGVEQGTASKWCELFGTAGIQFAFFGFASFWCDAASVLTLTALNRSSFPLKMSSTSDDLRSVILVAKLCGPSPDHSSPSALHFNHQHQLTHCIDFLPLLHCDQSAP